MQQQWIVVSDAARARIFSREPSGDRLTLVDTLEHAQSRAHTGDLRTGGQGTVHEKNASSQHQPDPQTTTSEKHADIFAKDVIERLKAGANDDAFDGLILIADPNFLGRLREKLDDPLAKTVVESIDKNWAQHDQKQIEKLLSRHEDA